MILASQLRLLSTSSSSSSSSRQRRRRRHLLAMKDKWMKVVLKAEPSDERVNTNTNTTTNSGKNNNEATPIDESRVSVPKVMQKDDFWDNDNFESFGKYAGKFGLVFVALAVVITGIVASQTYNEGAVEVDFKAYDSPEEAVAASMAVVKGNTPP